MDTQLARSYLLKLPGVGEKSARCVLMYSFDRDISPMDTPATRVMWRLGLLPNSAPLVAHRTVDERLPSGMAYRLHVNLLAHGKGVCKAANPQHGECIVRDSCFHYHNCFEPVSEECLPVAAEPSTPFNRRNRLSGKKSAS